MKVLAQMITLALSLSAYGLAYVSPPPPRGSALSATKEDMAALAEANPDYLGQSLGLWDPLGELIYLKIEDCRVQGALALISGLWATKPQLAIFAMLRSSMDVWRWQRSWVF